jgi:hypothetical protein
MVIASMKPEMGEANLKTQSLAPDSLWRELATCAKTANNCIFQAPAHI